MAWGSGNIGGDGFAGLNYSVVGGMKQPNAPRENTIWIKHEIEDVQINCLDEPTKRSDGTPLQVNDICIILEPSGKVFNALRRKTMYAFLGDARYYNGSKWNNINAAIYQNGSWSNFSSAIKYLYIYTPGDIHSDLVGHWAGTGMYDPSGKGYTRVPTINNRDSDLETWSIGGYYTGASYTANKISTIDYHSIRLIGNTIIPSEGSASFHLWTSIGSKSSDYSIITKDLPNGNFDYTIDISSMNGSYYFGFFASGGRTGGTGVYLKNMYLVG